MEGPNCGGDTKKQRKKTWKLVLVIVSTLLLALCMSVVIYWGITGVSSFREGIDNISHLVMPKENNIYRKTSYSVSDGKADKTAARLVATAGEEGELNNGLLQIFYWMEVYDYLEEYSYDAIYNGLDYTKPLDAQRYSDTGSTWQHYFLENAIKNWHGYQALALVARDEGAQLEEELRLELDNLRDTLTQSVMETGHSGIDALIQADMGPGCTYEDYEKYMQIYYAGHSYLNQKLAVKNYTLADIEAYFNAHMSELDKEGISKESGNLMDVRHILIAVEGGTEDEDGDTIYSQEEWDTCKAEAQALMDQWLEGEATEERFAQLAAEYSEDAGSNTKGGLYTSLNEESGFVPEFIEWYMDESRQPGDYGLLQTDYGYHVMYFSASEAQWIRTCREALLKEDTQEILNHALKQYPLEIDYQKIALGVVNLGSM